MNMYASENGVRARCNSYRPLQRTDVTATKTEETEGMYNVAIRSTQISIIIF